MAKTPQQMADKYKAGVANGQAAYTAGVNNTQKDPIALAIAAAPKYAQKTQEAIANGSYQKGLSQSNKGIWQQNSAANAGKFAQSAQTGSTKYMKYAVKAAPIIAQIQQQVQSMANLTDADAEARAIANIRGMRQLKGVRGN